MSSQLKQLLNKKTKKEEPLKYMLFKVRYPNTVVISFVNLEKLLMSLRIKNQD